MVFIGRGERQGKKRLFVLIASVQEGGYRRLFLEVLHWKKAALAPWGGEGVQEGTIILSEVFQPSDDFWTLRWNGRTFVLRYAGDSMELDCKKRRVLDLDCAEELIADLPEVQALMDQITQHEGVTPMIITESEPDPRAKAGTEAAMYQIYVGENHQTHTVRRLTFAVDARTRRVFIYDDARGKRIPLAQCRNKNQRGCP